MARWSPSNNIDLCPLLTIHQHDSLSPVLVQVKAPRAHLTKGDQWSRLARQDRRRGDAVRWL